MVAYGKINSRLSPVGPVAVLVGPVALPVVSRLFLLVPWLFWLGPWLFRLVQWIFRLVQWLFLLDSKLFQFSNLTRGSTGWRIFFPTVIPGSGSFQLNNLMG